MNEPETQPVVEAVQAGFARSDRVFWLDGGGSRDWAGRRSLVGVLDEDDVSLTYDAATGEVTRHQGDRDEVVGTDVFAVLEDEIARDAGDPDVHWVGCFGYASRPDLPARPWGIGPDAVWMRCQDIQFFDHDWAVVSRSDARSRSALAPRTTEAAAPRLVRRSVRPGAGAAAGGEQLRGQPDLPGGPRPGRRSAGDLPPAAGDQPRAVRRAAAPPGDAPAEQLAGALRHDRPPPVAGDEADQGDHSAGRHRRGRRTPARHAGHRSEVPRREPDDRRPVAQRPVDGLRGRDGGGAEPDGGGVLRERAPAGLDGARPAARRRDDRGRTQGAVPGRFDDRCAEAPHDGDHRRGRGDATRALRRCVRLDLRGRPRGPRRRDPLALRRHRRGVARRHRRRDHRPVRRGPGVGRDPLEGRPAASCSSRREAPCRSPGRSRKGPDTVDARAGCLPPLQAPRMA